MRNVQNPDVKHIFNFTWPNNRSPVDVIPYSSNSVQ